MANSSILINVGAATAGAVRNLDNVTKSLDKQKREGDDWGRQMFKAGNLAKAGFAAVGLAAVGAAASLISFGREAVEDAKQAENLANTLGNIPKVTQKLIDKNADWIDSMELATSISDTELRAAMARFATVTGDVARAQQLVALAADVSIGRNISLAAATKLVEKAATGHTEALIRQMPWLDKNKDGILTTAEAIDGLGTAYEDAAKKAADNDPWTRLQVIWGQLKEALGQWLLPLLKKFGDWFKDEKNQAKVQEMIDKVARFSYEMGTKAVAAIKTFIEWLKSPDGQQAIRDLTDLVKGLNTALSTLAGWLDKLKFVKFAWDVSGLNIILWTLNKIMSAMRWIADHWSTVNARPGGGAGSWSAPAPAAAATTVVQTVNITVPGAGSPDVVARSIQRHLRRAGDRALASVTAA